MYSNELICNILEYINNNINKEITIDELSIKFYFNKTYIMKKFKKELNITIHEYINVIRIFNSLSYFRSDDYFISIAFKNGFNSLEYFSETFKKIINVSPSIYKKYISHENISIEEEDKILESLALINNIRTKTINYINHKEPIYIGQTKKFEFKK